MLLLCVDVCVTVTFCLCLWLGRLALPVFKKQPGKFTESVLLPDFVWQALTHPSVAKQPQTSLESTLPLSIQAFPCIPKLPSASCLTNQKKKKHMLTIYNGFVCQTTTRCEGYCGFMSHLPPLKIGLAQFQDDGLQGNGCLESYITLLTECWC